MAYRLNVRVHVTQRREANGEQIITAEDVEDLTRLDSTMVAMIIETAASHVTATTVCNDEFQTNKKGLHLSVPAFRLPLSSILRLASNDELPHVRWMMRSQSHF